MLDDDCTIKQMWNLAASFPNLPELGKIFFCLLFRRQDRILALTLRPSRVRVRGVQNALFVRYRMEGPRPSWKRLHGPLLVEVGERTRPPTACIDAVCDGPTACGPYDSIASTRYRVNFHANRSWWNPPRRQPLCHAGAKT